MPLKPRLKYDPIVETHKYLKNMLQALGHNLNVLKDVSKPLQNFQLLHRWNMYKTYETPEIKPWRPNYRKPITLLHTESGGVLCNVIKVSQLNSLSVSLSLSLSISPPALSYTHTHIKTQIHLHHIWSINGYYSTQFLYTFFRNYRFYRHSLYIFSLYKCWLFE